VSITQTIGPLRAYEPPPRLLRRAGEPHPTVDILPLPRRIMARQLKRLLTHYGIDEAKPQASKQLIKRIKADQSRYIAQIEEAIESDVTHNATRITVAKREKRLTGHRYTKTQTSLSGRSHGRSTGPIKKSGANKRSGGGKEHGECMGASTRTGYKITPLYQVETTEYKKSRMGLTMNTQLKHIVEAYTALLELVE